MSEQQGTAVLDAPDTDAVAAAVLAAQMRIIDKAVRASRSEGWCGEFERLMGEVFPDGPPDGSSHFVDSDGWSCRDRDREGYNRDGYDADGFNRNGRNYQGWDRDGYDPNGFNRHGWNRDGINRDGRDRNDPEIRRQYRFDYAGYDNEGYSPGGTDRWGRTREDNARLGISPFRFNENGDNIDGQRR